MSKKVIVTGGAGFIGSALVRQLIAESDWEILNLDKLTYAGNLESLRDIENNPRYQFVRQDIVDAKGLAKIFQDFAPQAIMHLAAESHVDRSIDGPADFIHTNIIGTYNLLEASRSYWSKLSEKAKTEFRFLAISTDEVFGSLGDTGFFTEKTSYRPNSPYSASKASADHLVRAWYKTFGLPVLITNCSNNYGPRHFPEKLIPLVILKALENQPLPVYGKGDNIRDWLYVDDHARALRKVLEGGRPGETYNIGGNNEMSNLKVVEIICDLMNELSPDPRVTDRKSLITFVQDRPGHDKRYAIDATKITQELGWRPQETFETGIRKTVKWYLENRSWWQKVRDGSYQGERLGRL